MPANFYKALSAADLDAIVAYLRTITPVRHEVAAPEYKALVRLTQMLNLNSTSGLWPTRPIVEDILSQSVTAWNAIRRGRVVCQITQAA
jgi:hypothetical protein